MREPLILAIETSCDETAVAIARGTSEILASEVASQVDLHAPYGGVVPELASRNHNLALPPLVALALRQAGLSIQDMDAYAATSGPGLASSLLIGDTAAKALAMASKKPFYSINHLEGHLLSPFIGDAGGVRPNLALLVSGGHTMIVDVNGAGLYQVLGATRDDAAGEAFDKAGKMLGLPYPGGPEIDRRAGLGNASAFDFPRGMLKSGDYQFSFSGMKTALSHRIASLGAAWDSSNHSLVNDLCASFQAAVVEILVAKTFAAARDTRARLVTASGGVTCNRGLRAALVAEAAAAGLELKLVAPAHATDNAAMIAYAAACRMKAGHSSSNFDRDIDPNLRLVGLLNSDSTGRNGTFP